MVSDVSFDELAAFPEATAVVERIAGLLATIEELKVAKYSPANPHLHSDAIDELGKAWVHFNELMASRAGKIAGTNRQARLAR